MPLWLVGSGLRNMQVLPFDPTVTCHLAAHASRYTITVSGTTSEFLNRK